jgi:hypothetical protein
MTDVHAILTPPDRGYMGDRSRGASMGRFNAGLEYDVLDNAAPFHLVRIPLDSGGYDRGGVYWGHDARERLYGYVGPLTDIRGFVRARSRGGAKAAVRLTYPRARFFR